VQTGSLQLEQAPPLWVPASAFLAAPLFVVAAGLLLAGFGGAALANPWAAPTLALTHLGTLGLLGMVMVGALYQMTPVVAGQPVPGIRLAALVVPLLILGVAGLVTGLLWSLPVAVLAARACLGLGLLLFLVPVALAQLRATARDQTVPGMRLALSSLAVTGLLGLWMAAGHAGGAYPGDRAAFVRAHLALGLLGWVGGLIVAVSWQVLPMFFMAAEVPARWRRTVMVLIGLGAVGPALALLLGLPAWASALLASPAVLGAWLLHPALQLRALRARRRAKVDLCLRAWFVGLGTAPLVALAALAAVLSPDPRAGLLLGWLAIWGWAGLVVHGMLTRILPFLVWFHRFSPLVGKVRVPGMGSLLPERVARLALGAHGASVALGAVAILSGSDALARGTGGLVVVAGLGLGATLVGVLRRRG